MGAGPSKVARGREPKNECGVYDTLDNGGRAFRVSIQSTPPRHNITVDVSRLLYNDDDDDDDDSESYTVGPTCLTLHPARVFVGESPRTRMTKASGGHGPEYRGNSILLELADHSGAAKSYVHIGESVRTFQTLPQTGRPQQHRPSIVQFVSPVGRSGVPYPFAVDALGRIYLIAEDAVLAAPPYSPRVIRDPYAFYYGRYTIVDPPGPDSAEGRPLHYYSNDKPYGMTYTPDAASKYDRLLKRAKANGERLYIVQGGRRRELTRGMYIGIVQRFGAARGFAPIPSLATLLEQDGGGASRYS